MSYLTAATNTQTVTVATEIALVQTPVNETAIPSGATTTIKGVVACATGTGGTVATVKVRQGSGVAGTQVGPNFVSPTATANGAQTVAFHAVDFAPPANGVYTVTLTFTGNSSAVTVSSIETLIDTGVLNN